METQAVLTAILVAIALTWIPGAVVLLAARKRALTTIAAAPAITMAIVYVGTALAKTVGLKWSLGLLALTTILIGVITFFVARGVRRPGDPGEDRPAWSNAGTVFVFVMAAAALVIGTLVYLKVSDWFNIIPQDFDAVFQANAIRFIEETGDGTPQGLREINAWGSDAPYFYPSTFHALVALTASTAKVGVVAALHAQAITWFVTIVVGVVALLRVLRFRAAAVGVAVLFSTSFTSYPYELMWRGLYPYIQSIVLAIPVLVLMVEGARRRRVVDALLLGLAAAGLVSVHTSGATTLLVLGAPLAVALVLRERAHLRQVFVWLAWTIGVILVLLVPTFLGIAQISGELAFDWAALKSVPDGIESALLFGTGYRDTVQLALAVLVLPGALLAFWRRYSPMWALSLSMFLSMVLYVFAVSVDNDLSSALTGFWWNDQLRLAGLAAVLAPLFIAVLVDALVRLGEFLAHRYLPRRSVAWSARASSIPAVLAGSVALLVVFGLAVGASYFDRNYWAVHYRYTYGPTVSPAKVDAMNELGRLASPDGFVMNDNVDGSAWMYAIAGVRPVVGHYSRDGNSADQALLLEHFDEIEDNKAVQEVVKELGIQYVMVLEGSILPEWGRSAGVDDVADQPDVFELVYENPEARIYRILPPLAGSER
ncbi:DUF6541 family protein [Oerskovia sp. KBS0722]|uniref:DUF6541 family protein n=1 Tax=Oerskovia sp. KBS0722 TaxID=1179673 RepID=UPI00143CF5DA|nr:DUF6541 family protein [Oerskovia sp. KBS0722]